MVTTKGEKKGCESSSKKILSLSLVNILNSYSSYTLHLQSFPWLRGAWIRPMVGRDKRHWRKKAKRKIRGEKHVFCNATQSTLLDKMVTKYWRRRKYYVDDIYEPYHTREEFPQSAVKPRWAWLLVVSINNYPYVSVTANNQDKRLV